MHKIFNKSKYFGIKLLVIDYIRHYINIKHISNFSQYKKNGTIKYFTSVFLTNKALYSRRTYKHDLYDYFMTRLCLKLFQEPSSLLCLKKERHKLKPWMDSTVHLKGLSELIIAKTLRTLKTAGHSEHILFFSILLFAKFLELN